MAETIRPASLTEETRHRYLNYALSVITSRAVPDVRDGLKPVQRRILYAMFHDLRLHPEGQTAKCARIVGEVMGKYHPHGDIAIYDALVRLAQEWVMRVPLVIPQGNFGSVDGDEPAHFRYTEAKLGPTAEALMLELKQRTVDMRPTFDASQQEPIVLPAQFPNLLVNGTSGIAVGLATNIPPHNLSDVIKAAVLLIDDPEATTAQLLDHVKGPDFPLGGKIITDRPTLRKIYEEGHGSIKVQAEWHVEDAGRKQQIIVTSIPYGVNKGNLESSIGEIIESKALPQLLSVVNESNKKAGLRIVMEIKAGTDPMLVMAYLFKHTQLQDNFALNMTCLVPTADGRVRPERIGLRAVLRHFLDFRFATVKRRLEYELEQLRKRIHILDGFRIIFNGLDLAIRLIRSSQGKADAASKLIQMFKLSEIQADAILDAQLYKIAQLEIQKILDELKAKQEEAAALEALLGSEKRLWALVKSELSAIGEKFGTRRRTKLGSAEETPDFNEEAYIQRENTNVVLTRDGWIKRVGRLASVEGTRVREGDAVIAVVPGSTLDHVVFFADDGTAYTMRINEVPASSGYGEPIAKYFKLADQVKVIAALSTDERFTPADQPTTGDLPGGPYVLVVTAQGQTLRTPLAPFRVASNKPGRRCVRLAEGDKVVMVALPRQEETIYLASANGRVLQFALEEISILSGAGKGVIGIKLDEGDTCLGGALMGGRFDKFTLETTGGKTMEFGREKYEVVGRGGKGVEVVKRSGFARVVPPAIELVDWDKVEGKGEEKERKTERNGEPMLFE